MRLLLLIEVLTRCARASRWLGTGNGGRAGPVELLAGRNGAQDEALLGRWGRALRQRLEKRKALRVSRIDQLDTNEVHRWADEPVLAWMVTANSILVVDELATESKLALLPGKVAGA